MTSSFDAPNFIPGNNVADALADLKMAVRADPSLAVIGVCTDAGLGCVFDTPFDVAATEPEANRAEIKILNRLRLGLASARAIAAWH